VCEGVKDGHGEFDHGGTLNLKQDFPDFAVF